MAELTRPTRSLKNRVAIVTGAGALPGGVGNGRATAVLLAEAGCSVVCVDLKEDLAQHTVDMIESEGLGAALAVQGNVTVAEDCQRIVDTTIGKYGRLDILVNNVGIFGPEGTAVEVDMERFMKGLEVNVASMIRMAKVCIPKMAANEGQWAGSIVNMSSVAGLRGGTPSILYPTSKGAIVNMTRAMASNHATDRIRVNCVCPGKSGRSPIRLSEVDSGNRYGVHADGVWWWLWDGRQRARCPQGAKSTKDRGKCMGCRRCHSISCRG